MPIYDKPVRELMREMVEEIGLGKGEVISKDRVLAWFAETYPKVNCLAVLFQVCSVPVLATSSIGSGSVIHHQTQIEKHLAKRFIPITRPLEPRIKAVLFREWFISRDTTNSVPNGTSGWGK